MCIILLGSLKWRTVMGSGRMECFRSRLAAADRFRLSLFVMFLCIATGLIAQGQYFEPFHASSKKLFARASPSTPAYSMAFDSTQAAGADSIFFHFGALDQGAGEVVPGCIGWGDPNCYKANKPIWSGSLFLSDNNGTYWMRNVFGDSLRFDLGMIVGDTAMFFQDATQRFTIVKSEPDTMTVLDFIDSVYTYTVLHTDLSNQPIASVLNGDSLIVGKQLGMIRFFRVDSFPQVLEPLELVGNKGPDLGLHRITSTMVYDYQPGDVVQTKSYEGGGYPPLPFSYWTDSVLTRLDTPDSVSYQIAWEYFNADGTITNSGSGIIRYSKSEVLADLPFERFNGSHISLNRTSGCGTAIWILASELVPGIGLCPSENCWLNGDTGGPPPQSSNGLHLGLTATHYYFQTPINPWDQPYWNIRSLVYYRKNGVDCGTEQHVGIRESAVSKPIAVFPVPSEGLLSISSAQVIRSIRISDSHGRTVLASSHRSLVIDLDLSAFAPGVYQLELSTEDGQLVHHQFVLIR